MAIYTVDDLPFVVAGDASTPVAPRHVRPIAIQDTVAGRVRVTLNTREFGLPASRLLAQSWPFWLPDWCS